MQSTPATRPGRIMRALDGVSQILNVILLDGDANESISGRAYREEWETAERLINGLFFWQSSHCRESYTNDVHRARELLREHARRHGVLIRDDLDGTAKPN